MRVSAVSAFRCRGLKRVRVQRANVNTECSGWGLLSLKTSGGDERPFTHLMPSSPPSRPLPRRNPMKCRLSVLFTSCSNAHVAVLTCTGYFAFFFKRKMDFAWGTPTWCRPSRGVDEREWLDLSCRRYEGEKSHQNHTYVRARTCKRRVNTAFASKPVMQARWGELRWGKKKVMRTSARQRF